MAFIYNGTLTPVDKLSKNFKGKKLKELNDSHLTRGVIKAKEDGNDLSDKMKIMLKMVDQEDYLEGKNLEPTKEGFMHRPCPQLIVDRGSAQDIRVKPDRTTTNEWPSHVERAVSSYINQLNNKK